jgi:hypothetical protein
VGMGEYVHKADIHEKSEKVVTGRAGRRPALGGAYEMVDGIARKQDINHCLSIVLVLVH